MLRSLTAIFIVVPLLAQCQCGLVANIEAHQCYGPGNLWVDMILIINSGTPPFSVVNSFGQTVHTVNYAPPVYEDFSPTGGSECPYTILDGNGCVTSNFPQEPITFREHSIPMLHAAVEYDCQTGYASKGFDMIPLSTFEAAYTYTLSGPVNRTGWLNDLGFAANFVLDDLPAGNYLLEVVNDFVQTGTGVCNFYYDCNFGVVTGLNFTITPPTFTAGDCGVNVTARIALQGAMPSSGTLMDDDLRAAGMLPLTEPYSALGYSYSDPASAGATVPQSMFNPTGNDAIVDWVVVEIRASAAPHAVVASQPALLQRDGDVVDLDGDDYVNFFNLAEGNYRVAVRHRNHLGIMTGSSTFLGLVPKEVSLRDGGTYGADATTTISGIECLWSGNVNFDDKIAYTGSGNDRDTILVSIGGSVPTNTTMGYSASDVNMDGTIQYTGLGNDRDPILVNIGGSVPTNVRHEQLP